MGYLAAVKPVLKDQIKPTGAVKRRFAAMSVYLAVSR
jgi:hypothetical protein